MKYFPGVVLLIAFLSFSATALSAELSPDSEEITRVSAVQETQEAAEDSVDTEDTKEQTPGLQIDPAKFEAFLDTLLESRMEELRVPGVVFAMVKDGELLFSKGYGFADIENKVPVDPERTVFRVGSVSKVITATAVMQLAERGQVDLHSDVNNYLKAFKLPGGWEKPVTLTHLLTHTGGFDEEYIGIFAKRASEVSLGDYLAAEMPPRIREPGKYFQYSNHGMALAGLIVQEVSGIPFSEYVRSNILAPLGMQNSGFDLDPESSANTAKGYRYGRRGYVPEPFDYARVAPAGQFSASAHDMARFMIAHLQGGEYGDTRILTEESASEMHRRQFSYDEQIPGMAYGFIENLYNGQRVLWHGGDVRGFSSQLVLIPEHNMGLFVSTNSNSGNVLNGELVMKFFDEYFPRIGDVKALSGGHEQELRIRDTSGSYRPLRYARQSPAKVISLLEQVVINAEEGGSIVVGSAFGGPREPEELVEFAPDLFEHSEGNGRAIVLRDEGGNATHFAIGAWTWEKVPWYESARFHVVLVAGFAVVFLVGTAIWLAGCVSRLFRRQRSVWSTFHSRRKVTPSFVRHLTGISCFLGLLSYIGLIFAVQALYWEFACGLTPATMVLLIYPLVLSALILMVTARVVFAWINREFTPGAGLYYSILNVLLLAFVVHLYYWNLIGLPL